MIFKAILDGDMVSCLPQFSGANLMGNLSGTIRGTGETIGDYLEQVAMQKSPKGYSFSQAWPIKFSGPSQKSSMFNPDSKSVRAEMTQKKSGKGRTTKAPSKIQIKRMVQKEILKANLPLHRRFAVYGDERRIRLNGIPYVSAEYRVPGIGIASIPQLPILSAGLEVRSKGRPVIVTIGSPLPAIFTVVKPALNPRGNVPDPRITYRGYVKLMQVGHNFEIG